MCRQQELQEKLDESKAIRVQIETLNTEQSEQVVCLEREMETMHQQISVSFSMLILSRGYSTIESGFGFTVKLKPISDSVGKSNGLLALT